MPEALAEDLVALVECERRVFGPHDGGVGRLSGGEAQLLSPALILVVL